MHSLNCRWGFEPADRHAIRLLQILGSRAFTALQEEFGGKRVWVPKAGARFPCAACGVRAACVKRWRKAGRTPQAIAEHLGVSAKTVYRLLDLKGQERSRKEPGNGACRARMNES